MTKQDILSPADVTKLIKTFYDKLLQSSISNYFQHLDLKNHLPLVEKFWNTTLFPDYSYQNNLIEKHTNLLIKKEDYIVWVELLCLSVDELFEGVNAETTKNRAHSIAYIMRKKLLKD